MPIEYTQLPERLSQKLRDRYYELMEDCKVVYPKCPLWWVEACVGSYIRQEEPSLISEDDQKILDEEGVEWKRKLEEERANEKEKISASNVSEVDETN